MPHKSEADLSRREREIMNIIYAQGKATAAEVRALMMDPPSYSAVRATLRVLEEKGHLKHKYDGPRYMYLPTVAPDKARQSALKQLLKTFFDGSTHQAVATLLDMDSASLSDAQLDELAKIIEQLRKEGR